MGPPNFKGRKSGLPGFESKWKPWAALRSPVKHSTTEPLRKNHKFFKLLRKPMLVFEFLSRMLILMHSLFFEDYMIIQDYLAHLSLSVFDKTKFEVTRIGYFILMLFFCIPELEVRIIFVNFQPKNGRNNKIATKKKHTYQQLNLLNDRCTWKVPIYFSNSFVFAQI